MICENIAAVKMRIHRAALDAGRNPASITLLAVSKLHSASAIETAINCGQYCFGENYAQEMQSKAMPLDAKYPNQLQWHFIGPLQANKTRQVAQIASFVHSVDRIKIMQRLNDQRPPDKPPLDICIQVNISHEMAKSGVTLEALMPLVQASTRLPRLRLRGLMAIPAPCEDITKQRLSFARLREALEQLNASGLHLDTLSMGMTDDLEAAITEGATMVRIGTAIFGQRTSS